MDDMTPLFPLEAEPTPSKTKIVEKSVKSKTDYSNNWTAVVGVLLDGEKRYKSKGLPTKEEAQAALRELVAKVESGEMEAELRSKPKQTKRDFPEGVYYDKKREKPWLAQSPIKDSYTASGRRRYSRREFKTKEEAERAVKVGVVSYELNLLKAEGSLLSAKLYERAAHQHFEKCRLSCNHTKKSKSISRLGFKEWFKVSAQEAQDFLAEYFNEDRLVYKNGEELKEWTGDDKTEVIYVMRPEHKHIEYGDTCKIGITRARRLKERILKLSYESNTDVFYYFAAAVGELEPGSFRTPGIHV